MPSLQAVGRRNVVEADSSNFHDTEDSKAEGPESQVAPPSKPNNIGSVNLCIEDNSIEHHTDKYEICQEGYIDDLTKESSPAQLVIRRGQSFKVKVVLDNEYDKNNDHIRVVSRYGRVPLRSKGTHNEMVTGTPPEKNDWWVEVEKSDGKQVTLSVNSPGNCAIGKWVLLFDMVNIDENGTITKLMKKSVDVHCYMLFNCWCPNDQVYIGDEECRKEYVLNDSGKIYVGNYKQIFGKPWNFGQFESVVLEAALYLLNDRAYISVTSRGNPIVISRKLSALVNSSDDYGVLTGRWDGNYEDGVSPTKWTGSVAILQQFMEKGGKPVEYGQCWVFSGIMTTICRALGLPARSVTNFASAHDTDGSLTIDVHWNAKDEPIPELDTDSVWNFHVWNECWMTRPDLQAGYGGWQAVDATPQETSDGIYCAGPASLVAIKNGDVGVSYDTPFIFAEVNADKVHWCKQADGSIRHIIQRDVIGRNISTKAVGSSQDFSWRGYNPDREDITDQYKYAEGSQSERAAVWRAAQMSTKPTVYTDEDSKHDVEFIAQDLEDNIFVGQDFNIPLEVVNNSSQLRKVNLTVTLSSVYYTGVTRSKIRQEHYNAELPANSKEVLTMKVSAADYLTDMVDGYAMKINYLGAVSQTKQLYASQDDFRLRTIIPECTSTKTSVKKGETFKVKAKFTNPLKSTLTGCMFSFESAGNLKPVNNNITDVAAGATAEMECEVTAKRIGDCVVITSFECKQMGDLQGQCTVKVSQ